METTLKHIEANGAAFVDAQPVFADMAPAKEHVQAIEGRLRNASETHDKAIAELDELIRVYGRELDRAKNLRRRYGAES